LPEKIPLVAKPHLPSVSELISGQHRDFRSAAEFVLWSAEEFILRSAEGFDPRSAKAFILRSADGSILGPAEGFILWQQKDLS
jgi:hypothetical protein